VERPANTSNGSEIPEKKSDAARLKRQSSALGHLFEKFRNRFISGAGPSLLVVFHSDIASIRSDRRLDIPRESGS